MKINKTTPVYTNFKGHEAKKLQAILVSDHDKFGCDAIIKQLSAIANQYKVEVKKTDVGAPWTQDGITFMPNGKVISSQGGAHLGNKYGYEYFEPKRHLAGGNCIFATNKKGETVILKANKGENEEVLKELTKDYGLRIVQLPTVDFHADLFVTPIGDGKVFVADDELTLKKMEEMLDITENYIKHNPNDEDIFEIETMLDKLETLYYNFKRNTSDLGSNNLAKETQKVLQDEGFEVIKVPSRIYSKNPSYNTFSTKIVHWMNYSNAITFKDENNETIFLTGKTSFDEVLGLNKENIRNKLGFSFEDMFKESISQHIKPENVHFIEGDKNYPLYAILHDYHGGLHCLCAEVPALN